MRNQDAYPGEEDEDLESNDCLKPHKTTKYSRVMENELDIFKKPVKILVFGPLLLERVILYPR